MLLVTLHLGLNVVGFEVQVHPLLGCLGVVSPLKQYANFGVRQPELSVHLAARLEQFLLARVHPKFFTGTGDIA
jgi:hypothetical protein